MRHLASLDALQTSTRELLTTAATLDDAGLAQLGGELSAVARLLRRDVPLRRTLSEASTPIDTRAGIMGRLLRGQVGDPARHVVDVVVRQGWANGSDLRNGLERLGRTAMFLRAERSGELDEVEDQLFRFGRILDASPNLSVLLDDPTQPGDRRAGLVERVLTGRVHPLTIELLTDLARDPGGRSFSHGVQALVEQAAQRSDKVVASVESAVPLSEEQTQRLTAALDRIYSRGVTVHVEVVPSLAGGIRIRIGDDVIDGSVAGRLAELRRRLAG